MTYLQKYRGRGFDSRRLHHYKKMKDYLIWYRLKSDREDRVRGMARNWPRAEKMAEKLYFSLKINKKNVMQTGVKRLHHGQLYDDYECSLRWVVYPPELFKEK